MGYNTEAAGNEASGKEDDYGAVAQLVRVPACHAGCRGFESLLRRHFASVAQLVEQGTENPRVGGSTPPRGTNICGYNSVVECHLAKVKVEGPNPFARSRKKQPEGCFFLFSLSVPICAPRSSFGETAFRRSFLLLGQALFKLLIQRWRSQSDCLLPCGFRQLYVKKSRPSRFFC